MTLSTAPAPECRAHHALSALGFVPCGRAEDKGALEAPEHMRLLGRDPVRPWCEPRCVIWLRDAARRAFAALFDDGTFVLRSVTEGGGLIDTHPRATELPARTWQRHLMRLRAHEGVVRHDDLALYIAWRGGGLRHRVH